MRALGVAQMAWVEYGDTGFGNIGFGVSSAWR